MSFLSKVELKKQLRDMGINVIQGNYVKKDDIRKIVGDLGDLPLGTRYPKAKRKLSDKDIKELDKLFQILNKTPRYTKEWDALKPKINKLLGYECVADVDHYEEGLPLHIVVINGKDAGEFDTLDEAKEFALKQEKKIRIESYTDKPPHRKSATLMLSNGEFVEDKSI